MPLSLTFCDREPNGSAILSRLEIKYYIFLVFINITLYKMLFILYWTLLICKIKWNEGVNALYRHSIMSLQCQSTNRLPLPPEGYSTEWLLCSYFSLLLYTFLMKCKVKTFCCIVVFVLRWLKTCFLGGGCYKSWLRKDLSVA